MGGNLINNDGSSINILQGWQCDNRCFEVFGITQIFPLDTTGQILPILCTLIIAVTVAHILCDQSNPKDDPDSVVSTSSVVLLPVPVV